MVKEKFDSLPVGQSQELERAQEKANMMKAHLDVSPETGVRHPRRGKKFEGWNPSKEDYDRVFNEIEKLQQMAKDESSWEKIKAEFGRFMKDASFDIRKFLSGVIDDKPLVHDPRKIPNTREEFYKDLEDAAFQLKELQKKAREFEDDQGGQ